MAKKNAEQKNKLMLHDDHKKPVTRREFLAAGLLQFSGFVIAPTVLKLITQSSTALAADAVCATTGNSMMPFITLNLSGGGALGSNFVPHDAGGQLLTTYNKMGMGPGGSLPIEREFGNVPFAGNGISKLLAGIRTSATADTLSRTAFVGVCVRSQDDTSDNKFDISGLVAKSGLVGELLPNMGRRNSPTGINQTFAYSKPSPPLIVNRFSDVLSAVGNFNGALGRLNANQQKSLMKLIAGLSDQQRGRILASSGGESLSNLVKCATDKNVDLMSLDKSRLDPRANAGLSTLWNINANTGDGDQGLVFSTMVMNALLGNSSGVGLELGGFDYHDNSRTSGDNKDREAGVLIGRILESAKILGKKVFLYVMSDGSVTSDVSDSVTAPWVSDRGSAGVAYMISYDPAGRPVTKGFQLGSFTQAQSADDKFITGGTPEIAAAAVFANYLKLSGRMDLFSALVPQAIDSQNLDKVIMFG